MIHNQKVAAIIPARAGSQGIKNKNIVPINGIPLWMWSWFAAKDSKYIDEIIVSTDMPEIISEAKELGCLVVERPSVLATATASLDDSLLYSINNIDFSGILVVLQPTNPVRLPRLVDTCIEALHSEESVMTVNELQFVWKRTATGQFVQTNSSRTNRQEMDELDRRYHEDGCCYVCFTDRFRETGSRVYPPVHPIVIPQTVNIDTEADLKLARKLLEEAE